MRVRVAGALLLGLSSWGCGGDDADRTDSTPQSKESDGGGDGARGGDGAGSGSGSSGAGDGDNGDDRDAGGGDSGGVADAGSDFGTSDAGGCGFTNHRSGTRVRLIVAVTAEGDHQFHGYRDTELGIDCSRIELSDDEVRCLPSSLRQYFGGALGGLYFADAACTEPVFEVSDGCTPDFFLLSAESSTECSPPPKTLYARGDALAQSTPLYTLSGAACSAAPQAPAGELFRAGAEQDLSIYARASAATWSAAGGVGVAGYLGDDGARYALLYNDTARDMPCSIETLDDGSEHCVPNVGSSSLYADAACEDLIVGASMRCGRQMPTYGLEALDSPCGAFRLRRLQAELSLPATVYFGETCEQGVLDPQADVAYYQSVPAAPSEVPEVERERAPSDRGRLRLEYVRGAGGACLPDAMYDAQLDTRCSFGLADDGVLRCLPFDKVPSVIEGFADDACSMPLRLVEAAGCGRYSQFARLSTTKDCEYRTRVFRVSDDPVDTATREAFRVSSGGDCVAPTLSAEAYHSASEELAPEAFMAAELEVE